MSTNAFTSAYLRMYHTLPNIHVFTHVKMCRDLDPKRQVGNVAYVKFQTQTIISNEFVLKDIFVDVLILIRLYSLLVVDIE